MIASRAAGLLAECMDLSAVVLIAVPIVLQRIIQRGPRRVMAPIPIMSWALLCLMRDEAEATLKRQKLSGRVRVHAKGFNNNNARDQDRGP